MPKAQVCSSVCRGAVIPAVPKAFKFVGREHRQNNNFRSYKNTVTWQTQKKHCGIEAKTEGPERVELSIWTWGRNTHAPHPCNRTSYNIPFAGLKNNITAPNNNKNSPPHHEKHKVERSKITPKILDLLHRACRRWGGSHLQVEYSLILCVISRLPPLFSLLPTSPPFLLIL